ncbi:thiamine diphosphokinase [Bacillus sp. S/N-304-OC-R1]|uniref:thiamine diphosphokinase n=1 Tax=Bacillus sp. S/N-304-OC-R1 TaxID=2758034 RepID=UPI001C8D9955|nr:thiamine diphosphokinase [Bacillus sp. S/N-304-OC-R1]MBY0120742.1 thiamine diphosphokinase [Bacillus sp. S/N-304-OC-R1]
MNINILAGGPIDLLPNLNICKQQDEIWVGVDRGVFTLLTMGILPSIAFGDFDSVTSDEMSIIEEQIKEIQRYKTEKDETDMELALNWAMEQKPDLIRIFGGTGGRLDHFFANVQLLVSPILKDQTVHIEMMDNRNIVFIKGPGHYSMNHNPQFKYVSFIPITMEVKGLSLKGFKYPLQDEDIPLGSTLCISNELINDSGNFSFSKGIIMVVRSND